MLRGGVGIKRGRRYAGHDDGRDLERVCRRNVLLVSVRIHLLGFPLRRVGVCGRVNAGDVGVPVAPVRVNGAVQLGEELVVRGPGFHCLESEYMNPLES